MKQQITVAALGIVLITGSCASYGSYEKGRHAERTKSWDEAVASYEKALQTDPENYHYTLALRRAKLESSRIHFEKGKSLRAAAMTTTGADQYRLAELAATELELTVRLDPTNQYAAVELGKAVQTMQDYQRSADNNSIAEMKKRAKNNVSKAQPPVLNPASDQPISLSFPHDTPVKDIYRALGNAFGINIVFDQAVKDDRISIELKDVTAQQALERLMQAAGHFYKVLDEHTIIVVPDNPQARRDYEDLVIRTFYLSNGDAEQVTNVVRTMIEARYVFPLKALNAITIRDTADKVKIAEKIIEANDKAKAEVVVDVELLQLDTTKERNIGMQLQPNGSFAINLNPMAATGATGATGSTGSTTTSGAGYTFDYLRKLNLGSFSFVIPNQVIVNLVKNMTDAESLANPQLRISEGEKATLHIGRRIPVPVSTFSSVNTGTSGNTYAPVTSYQYQDTGIKVSIEPRVHHNREVTLKLTVEVSDQSGTAPGSVPPQPIISTRTIESTIRLKDGETNFLAGLIQTNETTADDEVPFLGDIPVLGRFFKHKAIQHSRTDLMLTMTPHIVRVPDITEDDVAPMWVGTTNNITFRGVSPRIESRSNTDPFSSPQLGGGPGVGAIDGAPAATTPNGRSAPMVTPGGAPSDPFNQPKPSQNPPQGELRTPQVETVATLTTKPQATETMGTAEPGALRLSPRIGPQPANLAIKPGEQKVWTIVGMDLDGMTATQLLMHYDPRTVDVADVMLGPALRVDPAKPPVVTVNRESGTVRIVSSDGHPLAFSGGGELAILRVNGGAPGDAFLVIEDPELRNEKGDAVTGSISGGRLRVN